MEKSASRTTTTTIIGARVCLSEDSAGQGRGVYAAFATIYCDSDPESLAQASMSTRSWATASCGALAMASPSPRSALSWAVMSG